MEDFAAMAPSQVARDRAAPPRTRLVREDTDPEPVKPKKMLGGQGSVARIFNQFGLFGWKGSLFFHWFSCFFNRMDVLNHLNRIT